MSNTFQALTDSVPCILDTALIFWIFHGFFAIRTHWDGATTNTGREEWLSEWKRMAGIER